MDFDSNSRSQETQDSKINVYNVVLSYVIEMNEYRSQLFTLEQMTGVTPAPFKDFIRTFFKLFTFTQSMLPEELREEIKAYFDSVPRKTDSRGTKGIELSMKMQRELENQRMITLYEETIVPPFVEPSEDEVPELIRKTMHNPVTGKNYEIGRRLQINPDAKTLKGIWNKGDKKGGKK
jgi:hypothetical protein